MVEREAHRRLGWGRGDAPLSWPWKGLERWWNRPDVGEERAMLRSVYAACLLRPRRAIGIALRALWPASPSIRWRDAGARSWRLSRTWKFARGLFKAGH